MKSGTRTRLWWLLTTLGALCLQGSPGVAQSTLVFHLARFDYVVGPSKCDDPSNPVSKLIKTAKEDAAQLEELLATKFPKDECAQRVRAEIKLGIKVGEYLESQGISIILHLEKADELASQLGRVRASGNAQFLLHCVFLLDDSNANQLDVTCTIKRLNGDCVGANSFHHPKPSPEKFVDLFHEDTSEHVTKLCRDQMQPGQQRRH